MQQFIRSEEQVDEMFALLAKRVRAFWNWDQHPVMEIELRPAKDKMSDSQRGLFWKWMEEMATYFSKNGHRMTKDEAYTLMCHNFLGYTDTQHIGKTAIQPQLRGISGLRVDEMGFLMDQVDAWAADKGLQLPTPADAAHEDYLKRTGKRHSK
jgi:hypothetical protein